VPNAAANSLTAQFRRRCNPLVPSRVAGQDGRVEPVEIRTAALLLRPWGPGDAAAVHRALQVPLGAYRIIHALPGVSGRIRERIAALVPRQVTAAGHEVAACPRRQAAVFGGDRPTPAAGPVTLRPPDDRDITAQVAAYRDPEVIRWYGVPPTFPGTDARTLVLLAEASGRVAEKAGITMEGLLRSACSQDDRRRGCRVRSIVADGVAA
jgi:hypothetical protein